MEMSSESPGSIGPYRLEKLLGRGGMGEVYQARDERLGRVVAIKHVRDDVTSSTARARFRREARAVALLNHPSIIQIFDVLEEGDGEWIVMELADGPSLAELLDKGPLEPLEALEWGAQIAEGLAEAHGKGLLHRDLKTENVMITSAGRAKILDFGLAKPLDSKALEDTALEDTASLSVDGEIAGTCRAMSPEQARGLELDRRSDLFSLGSLLYEMVTGEAPFRAASAAETLSRVCTHRPPPVTDLEPALPPALAELIEQLLEKTPELRPVNAHRVAGRLARLARLARASRAETTTTNAGPGEEIWNEATELDLTETSTAEIRAAPRKPRHGSLTSPWTIGFAAGLGLAFVLALLLAARVDHDTGRPAADSWELYREGTALLARPDKEGHVERAIEIFESILERDAESAPALAGLARALWRKYREGREPRWLEQAREVAEKAVAADEYLASARVSLGLVAMEEGRDESASSELELALVLDPTNADAHQALARLLRRKGDLPAAEAAVREAIAARPEDRESYDLLGAILFRVGRYEEAEAAFRASIELAPDSVVGHRNLAAVLAQAGRYPEASAALQEALEIAPDLSTYSNLGTLLFYRGLYARSAAAFEKALELPGGASRPIIWGNLGEARRASGSQESAAKAYRHAVRLLEEELETAPEDPERESRLALYLAKLGDEQRARVLLEALDSGLGTHASVLFRIAVSWEVCGERERALEMLERALAAGYAVEDARRDLELAELHGVAL